MNLLLEVFVKNGLLLDAAGIIGLSFLAIAALKLAKRDGSWAGKLVVIGALALLVARVFVMLSPSFISTAWLINTNPISFGLIQNGPSVFLTAGLAAIVYGLWAYDRSMDVEHRPSNAQR